MDLARAILQEAQQLQRAEQRKLMMDAMCAVHVIAVQPEETDRTMTKLFITQLTPGNCVLMFENARGNVVQCTRDTLAGVACDWSQVSCIDGGVHLRLYKLSRWRVSLKEFKHSAMLLDHKLFTDGDPEDRQQECLAVLQHYAEVVAGLRPGTESPWP